MADKNKTPVVQLLVVPSHEDLLKMVGLMWQKVHINFNGDKFSQQLSIQDLLQGTIKQIDGKLCLPELRHDIEKKIVEIFDEEEKAHFQSILEVVDIVIGIVTENDRLVIEAAKAAQQAAKDKEHELKVIEALLAEMRANELKNMSAEQLKEREKQLRG
jgi:hypothetical protein